MNAILTFARSGVRTRRTSLLGSFATIVLAGALLTVSGTWIQAGITPSNIDGSLGTGQLLAVAGSFAGTTVLIVLLLLASVVGQALRPRSRELALLRTIGATPTQVNQLVAAEMLVVFALAAPIGILCGAAVAPMLSGTLHANGIVPAGFTPTPSPTSWLAVVVLLGSTVLLCTWIAVHSVTRTSATAATRAASVDAADLGAGRRITAAVLASAGVAAAATPFVLGGLAGSAGAASSAIVLIIAAALAGPLLVHGAARGAQRLLRGRGGPGVQLATRSARGHSRRLTGVIIPLALFFALGAVQMGSAALTAQAGEQQLQAAILPDLVVEDADASVVATVRELPGVRAAGLTTTIPASVRTDSDEPTGIGFVDRLSWESTTLTVFAGGDLVSPDVSRGSLADLGGDTIAISSDVAAMTFVSVGDSVELEGVGGSVRHVPVVAVYDDGLAHGDYLVGSGFPGTEAATTGDLLVATDATRADVSAGLEEIGLSPMTTATYLEHAADAAADAQDLSTWATLVLLSFIALAGASSLVMTTTSRSRERLLLRRAGATSGQLNLTALIEALFVGLTAVGVGSVCAAPALLGISWALLGTVSPGVTAGAAAALAAVVLAVGLLGIVPATVLTHRSTDQPRRGRPGVS